MINLLKKLIVSSLFLPVLVYIPCTTYAQWFWDTFWVEGINLPWTEKKAEDSLIHTIRVAINRVLGMLSAVALVLCLYAWFKMMTSGWDSKQYSAGFSILKNAALWLAIIALSWLIVSLIFRFINWSINNATQANWSINNTVPVTEVI